MLQGNIRRYFSRSAMKRAAIIIFSSLGLMVFLFLMFRNEIAKSVLNSRLERIQKERGIAISYEKLKIQRLFQVNLHEIKGRTSDSIRFLDLNYLSVELSVWALLKRDISVNKLSASTGTIDLAILRKMRQSAPPSMNEKPENVAKPSTDAGNLFRRMKSLLPATMDFENVGVHYEDSAGRYSVAVTSLQLKNNRLDGQIEIRDSIGPQQWFIKGTTGKSLSLTLQPADDGALPIVRAAMGADIRVEQLAFSVWPNLKDEGQLSARMSLSVEMLRLKHTSLSSDTLVLHKIQTEGRLTVSSQQLSIDSGSSFTLNGIKGQYTLSFPLQKQKPLYALSIKIPYMPADSFFASLPQGAFDDTRNLKATGELQYRLEFEMDGLRPDSLHFLSSLEKQNFRILRFPGTPLTLMNNSFVYQAYQGSTPIRSFLVGPENPRFTPLEEIPQTLINCILTTEDPSFFRHGGFIPEAFRESIATNYKERSFKRGGSTISMQLIKNVFLNRKKTVFRKMEESLIVWLIESQRLTSKERMMEVYLNVIEWGPNVYGIGEASAFYFSKKPNKLTLAESLFLANIIPMPAAFRYYFDKDAQLREYMVDKSRFIAGRMVSRAFISSGDTVNFNPYVELKGPAKTMILPDELPEEEEEE